MIKQHFSGRSMSTRPVLRKTAALWASRLPVGVTLSEPTTLFTHGTTPGRESEGFEPRFRGAEATPTVASGRRSVSLENESAAVANGSAKTLARTGQERETPGSRFLDAGR